MRGRFHGWRKCLSGLAALTAFAVLPAAASAEDLYFRNDTNVPIIIQGSIFNKQGKVINDRPNLVQPGAKVQVRLPGNKIITIREARAPNRVLHQATVPGGMEDQYILVNPDGPTKLKLDKSTAKEFAGKK
jgi:hypothetical protein